MKKVIFVSLFFLLLFSFSFEVKALNLVNDYEYILLSEDDDVQKCQAVFGDPKDSNSIAFMLQEMFDLIKFLDVVLILGLTIVEFVKAIPAGEDALKKAITVTGKRLIAGIIIFFVPTVLNFIFDIAGFYGTCGIG